MIDPHIHLWDQRKTPRKASPLVKLLGWHPPLMAWVARRVFPSDLLDFFGAPHYVLADYLPPDYAQDTSLRDLQGYVHVQAGWEERGAMGPVGETRWLESLGDPKLKGIVAHADFLLGAAVEPVLTAHLEASAKVRGVRYMLAHHPDKGVHSFAPAASLASNAKWRSGYELLEKYDLSFDAWAYHHQLPELYALARDTPNIPMILCHLGSPVGTAGPFAGVGHTEAERAEIHTVWRTNLQKLAQLPNVSVKLSGALMPLLGFGYDPADPPSADRITADISGMIAFVIQTFGPERCMFASNFPVDKISASYAVLYDAYDAMVASFSESERRAMFHDNAVRLYRLPE